MMSSDVWSQCCRTACAVQQHLSNTGAFRDSKAEQRLLNGSTVERHWQHVQQLHCPFVSWAIYGGGQVTVHHTTLTQIELQVHSEL